MTPPHYSQSTKTTISKKKKKKKKKQIVRGQPASIVVAAQRAFEEPGGPSYLSAWSMDGVQVRGLADRMPTSGEGWVWVCPYERANERESESVSESVSASAQHHSSTTHASVQCQPPILQCPQKNKTREYAHDCLFSFFLVLRVFEKVADQVLVHYIGSHSMVTKPTAHILFLFILALLWEHLYEINK